MAINTKIYNSPGLPIYDDVYYPPNKRLKSIHPIWMLINNTNTEKGLCNTHQKDRMIQNDHLISDLTQLALGFEYQRAAWTALNYIKEPVRVGAII